MIVFGCEIICKNTRKYPAFYFVLDTSTMLGRTKPYFVIAPNIVAIFFEKDKAIKMEII